MSGVAETKESPRTQVWLDKRVHQIVKEYSALTGVPISRVMNDALLDWMSDQGATRIEALRLSRPKSGEILDFPSTN